MELPHLDDGWVILGVSVVGMIAWFSRLESLSKTNARDIMRLEKRQDHSEAKVVEIDGRVMEKLTTIERLLTERLAKIEGKLSK